MDLDGRKALIGGASKGIGHACARILAEYGAEVMLTGRNENTLFEAAGKITVQTGKKVHIIVADQGTREGTQRIIDAVSEKFGALDIYIFNTGGPKPGTFESLTENDFFIAHEQLFMHYIRMCRGLSGFLKKSLHGRIIAILSGTVKFPETSLALSGAYRSAIANISKTIASELAADGITVNNVCPSAVMTERSIQLAQYQSSKTGIPVSEILKQAAENIPMKKYQEPEDIAELCAFLASDKAANLTGQTITVDGGVSSYIY